MMKWRKCRWKKWFPKLKYYCGIFLRGSEKEYKIYVPQLRKLISRPCFEVQTA
jgi:hypothetical protein